MTSTTKRPVVCVMGPTASGKTDLAMDLADKMPASLISVDSALVYRGMDIGTAKPDATMLARAPHKLIDIRDPEENYSAGEFVTDAKREIADALAAGKTPLLVGGTMLYFRSLIDGLADLPTADDAVRERLDEEAARIGWPAMHERLRQIDPDSAARINCNDSQRIQRALEVFETSGTTLSQWHASAAGSEPEFRYIKVALMPGDRSVLHERIEQRLTVMMNEGFLDEVEALRMRPGLTARHASMRAVGYRQLWQHLEGEFDLETARYRALVATRQLAKRQLTWLRAESDLIVADPLDAGGFVTISAAIAKEMDL